MIQKTDFDGYLIYLELDLFVVFCVDLDICARTG